MGAAYIYHEFCQSFQCEHLSLVLHSLVRQDNVTTLLRSCVSSRTRIMSQPCGEDIWCSPLGQDGVTIRSVLRCQIGHCNCDYVTTWLGSKLRSGICLIHIKISGSWQNQMMKTVLIVIRNVHMEFIHVTIYDEFVTTCSPFMSNLNDSLNMAPEI